MAIDLKALGEEHPDVAKYCIDLVSALSAQGEHGHAVEIYEKAWAIYLKALGEEHHHVAAGSCALGSPSTPSRRMACTAARWSSTRRP